MKGTFDDDVPWGLKLFCVIMTILAILGAITLIQYFVIHLKWIP